FAQSLAEGFGQCVRTERVAGAGGGASAAQHRQPLVERHQCRGQAAVGLGHHAGDRQRFLELAVVHEAQFAAGRKRALRFVGARRTAGREIREAARDAFAEHPLDTRALLAGLAHAVEVFGLAGVAFGLLGKVEQRVIDVVEQFGDQVAGFLQRHLAHGRQQTADVFLAGFGYARTDADHLLVRFGVRVGGNGRHRKNLIASGGTGLPSMLGRNRRNVKPLTGPSSAGPAPAGYAGKSLSCRVPMPSSASITGMSSSIRYTTLRSVVMSPVSSGEATFWPTTVSTAPPAMARFRASSSSRRNGRTGVLVTGSQRMSSNRLSMPRTILVLRR